MNMFKITVFNFDVGRGAYGFFFPPRINHI